MLAAFQRLLNPHQVHSLTEGGPLLGYVFTFSELYIKLFSLSVKSNLELLLVLIYSALWLDQLCTMDGTII